MHQEYNEEMRKVMEQIDKDKQWFGDNYDSLRKQYPGSRYLAILNREILEHDSDIISFERKIGKRKDLSFYFLADFEDSRDLTDEPEPTGFSWSFIDLEF